jgi:DNA-binding NarL/FixJ family response regulator
LCHFPDELGIAARSPIRELPEVIMAIRLLVADDHEVVRSGVKSLVSGTDIKVVAEAATGKATVRLTLKHKPDVALIAIRMPEGDGLNTLGRIKLDLPDQPILMFSTYDNPTYIARAVALGASGFLLKGVTRDDLLEAIRVAATGESVWTREELRRVTGAVATPLLSTDADVPLTPRESEVLRQLAHGLTNKEVALALHVSNETVKEHVQHIFRKVGVSDRTQAAVWAVRKGLA